MKKGFFTLLAGLMMSAQMMAVTTQDVCGRFQGLLNIGGQTYQNKQVYLLPGTVDNTVTFVLPDFTFGAKGKLGNIVLPNIPMDAAGKLTLENSTLYLDSIQERATITVLNGLEDGGRVYNSIVTDNEAQVLLQIGAPSLPQPILVLFQGTATTGKNYMIQNGGFEGAWTNNEPAGWHSFGTATGLMADFVLDNTYQFVASTDVRPGTSGSQSALLSSNMLMGVKANGNCTNGQINAGSMTADAPADNYNFSDPTDAGYNTPLQGRPDSLVFWAKYVPADKNPANEVNRARASVVLTTDARYQDPETANFGEARIAKAEINFAATAEMGWQRLAVPFLYNSEDMPAYILTTFTTNQVPGGGSSYSIGSSFSKVNVVDSVYLDDVELVYNKQLNSFTMNGDQVAFDGRVATLEGNYCDNCAKFAADGDGRSAQTFIAFDAAHKCIYVYIIADDYQQSGDYRLYRVEFADSQVADLNPLNQAVDEVLSEQVQSTKVLRNGRLYIRRQDGVLFDLTGRKVN